MKLIRRIGLLFIIALVTHGAIARANLSVAVPFYRSPKSLFASGQENRSLLDAKIIRTELGLQFKVKYENLDYIFPAEQIYRDLEVSSLAKAKSRIFAYEKPNTMSLILSTLLPETTVAILGVQNYWAEIFLPKQKKRAYVPAHLLRAVEKDEGVILPLLQTKLLTKPDSKSAALAMIPKGTRLLAIEYMDGFIRVQYKAIFGFVESSHVLGRADFAKWGYVKSKGWQQIRYRNNDKIVLLDSNESVPVKSFQAFVTNPRLGIVNHANEDGPALKARVQIEKMHMQNWAVSALPKHGEVFWRQSEQDLLEEGNKSASLSTDLLLKKEIQSVAFSSGSKLNGLVSAKGIYRTDDGETWQLIPQFGNEDHAVAIHSDGTWFVGAYRSRDKGKTFEPFIRWDLLAERVQEALARPARYLKIKKIEAMPASSVLLTLETGVERLHLKGKWQDNNWQLVR